MQNQIIINAEYFLQCAGSCSGCFLSEEERNSSNVNASSVIPALKNLISNLQSQGKGTDFFVVGLGRGNNLQLKESDLHFLGNSIREIEALINSKEIVFEVSTSLIGKIDKQIENAKLLLNYSNNIYFNVVINSEITSTKFWDNVKLFHSTMTSYREEKNIEKTGDVLVLNVNPNVLPNLSSIKLFKEGIRSPINISIFPFDENLETVSETKMEELNQWCINVSEILKNSDFNVKNQLGLLGFEIASFKEAFNHVEKTKGTYFFVDQKGVVTPGQPSIMGEVDYPRLVEKYKLDINLKKAFLEMQKNIPCSRCEFQKECLITGAYLNMLANKNKLKKTNHCPSGYKEFFKAFLVKTYL